MNFFRFRKIVYLILATIVIVIAAVGYVSTGIGFTLGTKYLPSIDACMVIKLEITKAHFVESVAPDENNSDNRIEIRKHIEEAIWHAEAIINGGANWENRYTALEDSSIISKAETLLASLKELHSLVCSDREPNEAPMIFAGDSEPFDDLSNEALEQADELEEALHDDWKATTVNFGKLQTALFWMSGLLILIIGLLLWQYEKSRTLIVDELKESNIQLSKELISRKQLEEERLALQGQLQKAEQMKALGLLAGGVAHDLNNMLGPVAGYAELLLREVPEDSKIATRIKKIASSAHDASDVIQDLLTLARRGRYQMAPLQLNDVVSGYFGSPGFEELQRRHPMVTVDLQLKANVEKINGSSPHLSKVIMNLVSNAFEAMSPSGHLIVKTQQCRLDGLVSGFKEIITGHYVQLHVKDTGVGIQPEDMAKIFEPYFSKKTMGHSGSGLGLSVVYGVVKDHGGYYDIFSKPGQGTEFVLYFPVCAETSSVEISPHESTVTGGTETVLVVDDNSEQRDLLQDVLKSLGYTIFLAENGNQAILFLKKQTADLVMLDMIMEPDMDGLDTYRGILKINPNQTCMIVSGYAESERVQELIALGVGPLVRKPFRLDEIAKAAREALSRRKLQAV